MRNSIAIFLLLVVASVSQASAEAARCPDGKAPRGDLGITSLSCHCSFKLEGRGTHDSKFYDEPEILSIAPGGPSSGRLFKGDRVVAIDGELITTSKGGKLWSNVQPGQQIHLRVRRDASVVTVELTAGAKCDEPEEQVAAPKLPARLEPRLHASDLGERLLPRGWLGFALACNCSVNTNSGAPEWTFVEPPTIHAVAPASPGARAGLRSGDTLLEIDGHELTSTAGGATFSRIVPGQSVRLTIERDGTQRTVNLVAGTRPTPSPSTGQ